MVAVELLCTELSTMQQELTDLKANQQQAIDKKLESDMTEDTESVKTMLTHLEVTPANITDCRHLGPYSWEKTPTKPRPPRLSIESQHQKDTILKAAHKLKDNWLNKKRDITLRKDLTKCDLGMKQKALKEGMAAKKAESTQNGDIMPNG